MNNDNPTVQKRQLTTLEDISKNPSKYRKIPIISGIVNEGEVLMLYGKSGGGKTFISLDFALSVSCHLPMWCNCEIVNQRAKVLYFACESPEDVFERAEAWRLLHKAEPTKDFIVDELTIDYSIIEQDLKQYSDQNIKLVFIDTVSASTLCEDENNAGAVATFIAKLHKLAKQYSLAFVIVHHSGKDDGKKKDEAYRGSSAFYGNSNTVLQVHNSDEKFDEKTGRNFAILTFDKSRKKKPFKSIVFDIFQQAVDFDGESENIGVVQPRETENATEIRNNYRKHQTELEQFIEIYKEKTEDVLTWEEYRQKLVSKGYFKTTKEVLDKWRTLGKFFEANGIVLKDKKFFIVKGKTADVMLSEPPKEKEKTMTEKEVKDIFGNDIIDN